MNYSEAAQWLQGIILVLASIGVITVRRPVYSALFFMLTLFMLAGLYLQLSADFISVMQVLVYAGAILVIFMFVIVLFQDAHYQLVHFKPKSAQWFVVLAASAFSLAFIFLGQILGGSALREETLPEGFGSVENLGIALYTDYFFPFEAVILIFLVAIVGALYIAKKAVN